MYNRNLIIKVVDTLNDYRDLIHETWITLIRENITYDNTPTIKFLSITITMDKLMKSFVTYLLSGIDKFDENIFTSIAYDLPYKDIPYDQFMKILSYFEESCTSILVKKVPSNDFVKYLLLINSAYIKAITCISQEYFSIKDTTVTALVKLAELRDDITGTHLERTKEYAVLLSKQLGLDKDFIRNIEKASLLHDIGKVGIRDSILLKPEKLTQEEFDEIKQHTIIGARTIYEISKSTNISNDYLMMSINIALHHHEKYDGSGYPHNLKGEEIPLEARIFALADAYDVIVSRRPYKRPATHHEAVKRIVFDSGKHFDPVVVNAFLKVQNSFNKISINHSEELYNNVI